MNKPDEAILGWAYRALEKPDEAIRAFERAIELDETSAVLHLNLGSVYRELKKPDEAMQAFKRAIELDENDACQNTRYVRGRIAN